MPDGLVKARREATTESDEQLTDRVRSGDQVAFGELYRRHRRAAETTARCLLRSRSDADDVVSDAFAGVLSAIRNGRGPRDNFRRYLMACVRNGCRTRQRTIPIAPEDSRFEPSRPGAGPQMLEDPERYIEADTVARAFSSLTPRWQQMLWSTAVEQKSAQEVGLQMHLSPNAVAALNHRAREAFATAYLAEHSAAAVSAECVDFARHLAGYVRGQLPPARFSSVERHVAGCLACTKAVDDLRDVNASLRSLGPGPVAAVAMVAAPIARSGSRASVFNLPYAGTVLKGVAGLLLLAPLLVTGVELFKGGDSSPDALIREVQQATTTVLDDESTDEVAAAPDADDDPAAAGESPVAPPLNAAELGNGVVDRPEGVPVTVAASTPATGGPRPASGGGDDFVGGPGVTSPTVPSPTVASTVATTAPPATSTTHEGLLGTLGVDDLVEEIGLPQLVGAVETLDDIVLTVTRDVVAPVLDAVLSLLPIEIDPAVLPSIPGVVLLPQSSTAPSTTDGTSAPPGTTSGEASGGGSVPASSTPAPNPPSSGTAPSGGGTPSGTAPTATPPPATSPATTPATSPATSAPTTAPPSGGGLLPPISITPIQLPLLPLPPIQLPVITIPGLIG
jgi:RNA polymerase sigma factor (sigma-70 family)